MASILFFIILIFSMLCVSPWPTFQSSSHKKGYIVLVVEPYPSGAQLTNLHPKDLNTYYNSFLSSSVETTARSDDADVVVQIDPRILYAYRHALTGFSVMLSANELENLKKKEGVLFVWPERIYSLHTTHSPSFLGLNQNIGGLWSGSNYGKGVIIGLLDTGISSDHPSFSDKGMPPPPAKWKVEKPCQFMTNFTCNNKIIGARSFMSLAQNETALDDNGHGTHTSSTAAGNFVGGANFFGNANGTASGIAPRAHLAIYKVCNASGGCRESAIIAGMDAAIEDGVDVLSLSLGAGKVMDNFYKDPIAIGAFRAMEKGIFVSLSAGNTGPYVGSVENGAPWALTVGASTIDREIRATVVLGNNQEFHGQTAFQPEGFTNKLLPLLYVRNCSNSSSLNKTHIRGKIVVCEIVGARIAEGKAVRNAGGAAMILLNFEELANMTYAQAHVLPAANVVYADGLKIKAYINSTKKPVAKIIFRGTVIGDNNTHAPVVAAFSSRGPNPQSLGILKPDILGPGVSILAAWPTSVEKNRTNNNTKSTFNMISGTSMSCPHLGGVAALLKSLHPDWSPAAMRSAIVTTADDLNRAHGPIEEVTFLPADIFATGAGHVNPGAASDPGLIYDIEPEEYVPYLCGLNYTDQQVRLFLGNKAMSCSEVKSIPEAQLNYPSFALTFTGKETNPQTYTRTVTNVGEPHSSYNVTVVPPPGIEVCVEPKKLSFSNLNQKVQYKVTFSRKAQSTPKNTAVKGFLKLCSSKQCVKSPIAVILQ